MSTSNISRNVPPIVFTGCSVTDAAQGQPQAGGQRRQVIIKGKRVKTIDVHAHCLVPETLALIGETLNCRVLFMA